MNALLLSAVLANPVGPAPLPIHYAVDPAEYLLVQLAGRRAGPRLHPPISRVALSIHYARNADEYLIAELLLNRIGLPLRRSAEYRPATSPWSIDLPDDLNEATRLAAELHIARGESAEFGRKATEEHPGIGVRQDKIRNIEKQLDGALARGSKIDRRRLRQIRAAIRAQIEARDRRES